MNKFEAIRTEIKTLSEDQKIYKPRRKPKNAYQDGITSGFTARGASELVLKNKYELRHLFQAYAILKGKERPKVTKSELDESKIQKLIEKYKPMETEAV
jgi:hypothetical protein